MKLFLRILSYLKKVWPNVILGLFALIIYASFSGVSLGIVYPVVDEIFVKQTEEEWKADEASRSSANLSYIFMEAEWLFDKCVQAVKHNWKEKDRFERIKEEISVSLKRVFREEFKKHYPQAASRAGCNSVSYTQYLNVSSADHFQTDRGEGHHVHQE